MADQEQSLDRKRRFIATQRELGLCLECTNKVKEGRARCEACLARRQKKLSEHKATANSKGLCAYCLKKPKMPWHRMCEKCYCRDVSWKRFGTTKKWQALLDKFQSQNGKCAISGGEMTLGKDTELDHIVPTSRGGENTLENTQWVLMVCNRMKDNLLEDEFFGMIERIYHTMKGKREALS